MQDIVLYYFHGLPEVCFYYYAELNGYHHARFLRDFLKKSHEARLRNPRDYFGVLSVTLIFPKQNFDCLTVPVAPASLTADCP